MVSIHRLSAYERINSPSCIRRRGKSAENSAPVSVLQSWRSRFEYKKKFLKSRELSSIIMRGSMEAESIPDPPIAINIIRSRFALLEFDFAWSISSHGSMMFICEPYSKKLKKKLKNRFIRMARFPNFAGLRVSNWQASFSCIFKLHVENLIILHLQFYFPKFLLFEINPGKFRDRPVPVPVSSHPIADPCLRLGLYVFYYCSFFSGQMGC